MRITIGHVLVSGGAGFIIFQLYFNPAQSPLNAKASNGMLAEIQSWVSLFQTGESSSITKVEEPVPAVALASPIADAAKNSVSDIKPVEANKVAVVGETVAAPPEAAIKPAEVLPVAAVVPVVKAAPVVRARAQRKAAVYKKRTSPLAQAPQTKERRLAVAPPSQLSIDQMIGSYVSVELLSGKKVLGILQEKTAKEVKIQLPGMGPFSYPAETVKSIQPAE